MYSLYLNCASVIAEVLNVGLTATSTNATLVGKYECPRDPAPFKTGESSISQAESFPVMSWNLQPSAAASPSKSKQAPPSITVGTNGQAPAINGEGQEESHEFREPSVQLMLFIIR
jgi:hypothetical protein